MKIIQLSGILLLVTALVGCAAKESGVAAEMPTLRLVSGQEAETAYEEAALLELQFALAIDPELEVPEVERIRVVPSHEHPQVIADCINAAGFTATVNAEGDLVVDGGAPEQVVPLRVAHYTCLMQYPQVVLDVSFGPEEAAYQYDHYVTNMVPCLEREGWPLPEPPPSRQSFIDGAGAWYPMAEIEAALLDEADRQRFHENVGELQRKCPATSEEFRNALDAFERSIDYGSL